MERELEDWVELTLREAERRKCVRKVLSMEKEPAVGKGENYTSDIERLKLTVQQKDGQVVEKWLILKSLPVTEFRHQFMKDIGLSNTEAKVYRDVLPMLETIRQERDKDEPLWGECYGLKGLERLLFEDLCVKGYKMGLRMKGLDFDHCSLVMRSLGKYHALTVVLKERGDLTISDYAEHWVQRKADSVGKFYNAALEDIIHAIESSWEEEWIPYASALTKINVTLIEDLLRVMEKQEDKFNVLNHGDCWVNNMLFKYDHEGRPIYLRFIDFQVCFYNSPAFDLQYFLNTSPQFNLRPRFEELIKIYYESLVTNLQLFRFSGEIPSFEDIIAEFRRISVFGIATALAMLKIVLQKPECVPDLEETLKRMVEKQEVGHSFSVERDEYTAAQKTLLSSMKEEGLLPI